MKTLILTASLASVFALGLQFGSARAYAAGKVDCEQVMSELKAGKSVAEVAKDMGVARRSVRRCRRHYGSEGEAKMGGAVKPTPSGSMASPAAAPAGQ
jgi:Helix-turn-helix domain